MPADLQILGVDPGLRVCKAGHVTDPFVDIDTLSGKPVEGQMRTGHSGTGYIERGGVTWTHQCRYVVQRSAQSSGHQCGQKIVGMLSMYPAMEAAYAVGGAVAVLAMAVQQPWWPRGS